MNFSINRMTAGIFALLTGGWVFYGAIAKSPLPHFYTASLAIGSQVILVLLPRLARFHKISVAGQVTVKVNGSDPPKAPPRETPTEPDIKKPE